MKPKLTWWKLYLFAAAACVILFLLPQANRAVLMLWTLFMFGGIAVWLMANEAGLTESAVYRYTVVSPGVAEFFDDDRVLLQQYASEIADDNIQGSPQEAA